MDRRGLVGACVALVAIVGPVGAEVARADDASVGEVTIQRTAHGIPHITARTFRGLGFGYGYAAAQDNICTLADDYVTVDARRSATFGPGGSYTVGGNGTTPNNLNSDFFWQRIKDEATVEHLVAVPVSQGGPKPEVLQATEGFAAGYNAELKAIGGAAGVKDPACRNEPWVRPITAADAYRRYFQLALLASAGVAVDGIGNAQPTTDVAAATLGQAGALPKLTASSVENVLGKIGSNAVALGKAGTQDHGGLLLGNPHFPWTGSERFYQSQLTIPGTLDVAGGSLLGVPVINIGFTRGLAWSHTVSTARRFTIFELKFVPGTTTYLVDGVPHQLKESKLTVMARQPDGSQEPISRTLYETDDGKPMITSILGLPVFPWTPAQGYAMGDANATNFGRLFNHFLETNEAQSVPELQSILRRNLGIPWVNTIAADTQGRALYADLGTIPNVSDSQIATCSAPLGAALDKAARLQVLDGSRSGCGWATDADAPFGLKGIFGPAHMPMLLRDDYVTNSNDSYWLSNPLAPLTGFPRIIGDERTARSPRTRLGLRIVQQRLDGTDGLSGPKGFTPSQLMDAVFNDRQYLGELWRDPLVAMCEAHPTLIGSNGLVDVSAACPALKAWDRHDNLESRGSILFRRFAEKAIAIPGAGPWTTPFNADDAVNTPNGLNTSDPLVQKALADAVSDLRGANIALDAPLGQYQYDDRGGTRIPIHGGPGPAGLFNVVTINWDPKKGYVNPYTGSSYVQVVRPNGGCPDAHTILTYSQSADPTSPFFRDQTKMFSRKEWVKFPFCQSDILADPALTTTNFNGGALSAKAGSAGRCVASSMITAARLSRRARVLVRGRSAMHCAGGSTARVRRVDVAIVRRAGKRCRYVRRGGSLSRSGSCRRLHFLRARGSARWSLKLRARSLPAGLYTVVSRASAAPGETEPAGMRRLRSVRLH